MEVEKQIKEVFSQIKGLLEANEEMGLEPPPLSTHTHGFLEGNGQDQGHRDSQIPHFSSLRDLREYIGECRRCRLSESRARLVFGEGSSKARLVFVGEGPGHEEDMAGRPFVGESGRLLTRIIENGMGLTRDTVYICNVVKCHPPNNRDPKKDETETCIPFLRHQLRIIKPDVVCALGRVAGQALLGADFKISADRGKWYAWEDIPLMPTYHPAYLLRNASAKRQVWEDIKRIMRKMGLEVKKND